MLDAGPLRNRNALLFVAISLLSGFGSAAMSLVIGVWILDLTGSSSLASLAGLCIFTPTLLGPLLGALVDRFPRRALLIWTNVLMAVALLCLLGVRSRHQIWLIFAVMLAYGVSYVLLDAGEAALLPAALPSVALGRVNGLRMSAQEGMKLLAPLIGAGLYSWQGGRPVAALSALVLLGAAGLYGLMRIDTHRSTVAPRRRRDVRAGVAFLRHRRVLRTTILIAATTIAMSGFTTAAVYAMVTINLHLPATFLGILASAQGAGSIVGGLIVGRLLTRYGEISVGALGALVFAAGCAARCLPWWPLMIASSIVAGIGLPWTLIAAMTAVQLGTPPPLLGRVAATANTLLFAPIALAIPIGSAAIVIGSRPPLIAAALLCLAAGALPLTRRRARAQRSGAFRWHPMPEQGR